MLGLWLLALRALACDASFLCPPHESAELANTSFERSRRVIGRLWRATKS